MDMKQGAPASVETHELLNWLLQTKGDTTRHRTALDTCVQVGINSILDRVVVPFFVVNQKVYFVYRISNNRIFFFQLTHSLQKDLFIYKSTIQARYEEKIEEQASNLYKYVNDRLTDIETFHKRVKRKVLVQLNVNLHQMPLLICMSLFCRLMFYLMKNNSQKY